MGVLGSKRVVRVGVRRSVLGVIRGSYLIELVARSIVSVKPIHAH